SVENKGFIMVERYVRSARGYGSAGYHPPDESKDSTGPTKELQTKGVSVVGDGRLDHPPYKLSFLSQPRASLGPSPSQRGPPVRSSLGMDDKSVGERIWSRCPDEPI